MSHKNPLELSRFTHDPDQLVNFQLLRLVQIETAANLLKKTQKRIKTKRIAELLLFKLRVYFKRFSASIYDPIHIKFNGAFKFLIVLLKKLFALRFLRSIKFSKSKKRKGILSVICRIKRTRFVELNYYFLTLLNMLKVHQMTSPLLVNFKLLSERFTSRKGNEALNKKKQIEQLLAQQIARKNSHRLRLFFFKTWLSKGSKIADKQSTIRTVLKKRTLQTEVKNLREIVKLREENHTLDELYALKQQIEHEGVSDADELVLAYYKHLLEKEEQLESKLKETE